MSEFLKRSQWLPDLTTQGVGANPDSVALVYKRPRVDHPVPGREWHTQIGTAQAIFRFPEQGMWNGKIMIGATPAVRSEYSLDLLLGDDALFKGYAYAACDKGTPGLTLRDSSRQMSEWLVNYKLLTDMAHDLVLECYGETPKKTYIAGVSNGGYIVRAMLERYPEKFDGGVEWEGVLWNTGVRHLLTTLPTYIDAYPILMNWRGDRTEGERHKARDKLLDAGLNPQSSPHWDVYMSSYWIVSLWLYGHSLDPDWPAFQATWNNDWLKDPRPLGEYPFHERIEIVNERIAPIELTGHISKPLLSVAGNWDCLVPFAFHAKGYEEMVRVAGSGHLHRLYEIMHGNHVDGLLIQDRQRQEPVLPYFETAVRYLEQWVEDKQEPPTAGSFSSIQSFAGDMNVISFVTNEESIEGSCMT